MTAVGTEIPDVIGGGLPEPALVAAIRALHKVVVFPNGAAFCDHCCLNRALDRRFACHRAHIHQDASSPPCPTLAILERLGL